MVHSAQKFPKHVGTGLIGILLVLSIAINFMNFTKSPYSFREEYQAKVLGQIEPQDDIVTILPSFAEVMYYRNQNNLENDLIVLDEGLIQFSGKSLLDAYVANGNVVIGNSTKDNFELRRDDGQIRTIINK